MLVLPALLLPVLTLVGSSRAAIPEQPNVLILLIDDLGSDMVGYIGEGDPLLRPPTPNLDRLARRSIQFTQAYSRPICSPTRAAMLTGRHAFRTGVGGLVQRNDPVGLPFAEVTIPEFLDLGQSGYDHIALGKWHLGTESLGGARNPVLHGFRRFVGTLDNVPDYWSWKKVVSERNGATIETTEDRYLLSDQIDEAIQRIPRLQEPWFAWVALTAVHSPFHVPPAELHHQGLPETEFGQFRAMVEATDREIGRLLRGLSGQLPRTVLMVASDNGSPVPVALSLPAKGSLNEGGVNVPFLVSGPVVAPEHRGVTCDALVDLMDVYATVAELAGVDLDQVLPASHVVDSISLMPLLADPRGPSLRRTLFLQKFDPNGFGPYTSNQQMLRNEQYKIIRNSTQQLATYSFHDLLAAPPGSDGDDLCPCPLRLSPSERIVFQELLDEILALIGG